MLQDRAQDVPQNTTCNTGDQQTDLVNGIEDLTLDSKPNVLNSTASMVPPLDVPEEKGEGEDGTGRQAVMPMYKVTEQETQLQEKEEEYRIYMNTFGYEGDHSDLDSNTESK